MKYMTACEAAEKWAVSVRTVREYCASGRIIGAFITPNGWLLPENSSKPERRPRAKKLPVTLLERLKAEKEAGLSGGIYHRIQIDMTYNSNHIEGSTLTHEQTRHIFETHTFLPESGAINTDDIAETVNHFRCIDLVIDMANYQLSESLIKQLHGLLKSGTSDSRQTWFVVGDYKRYENEVGGHMTAKPGQVKEKMRALINEYNSSKKKTLEEIIEFHWKFEEIHPFQDGNGRVGRLIMFKECLKNGITPFIIDEERKLFYYRGLHEWKNEKGYLIDTCLSAQDAFKAVLTSFGIGYSD